MNDYEINLKYIWKLKIPFVIIFYRTGNSMQKLKAIIKKAVNRDILDVYKYANPSTEDFSFTIHCF